MRSRTSHEFAKWTGRKTRNNFQNQVNNCLQFTILLLPYTNIARLKMKKYFIILSILLLLHQAFAFCPAGIDMQGKEDKVTCLRETSLKRLHRETPHEHEIKGFYSSLLHRHDKEKHESHPWGVDEMDEDVKRAALYRERLNDMKLRLNRFKSDQHELTRHNIHELEGIVTTLLRITESIQEDDHLMLQEDQLLWDKLRQYDEDRESIWKMLRRTLFLIRRRFQEAIRSLNPFRKARV